MAVKASATITLSFMVDVKAVYRYYKLQASTASAPSVPTTATPSGWTDTEPTYTEGSTNTLYFVDKTVFTNDEFVYSLVSKSTSYEAAKIAYNKALHAAESARATANHFFADSDGVHVSESADDASTGHNILVNSLGLIIRRALKHLVSITENAVAFFDGEGNGDYNQTAIFGKSSARIGRINEGYTRVTPSGMSVYTSTSETDDYPNTEYMTLTPLGGVVLNPYDLGNGQAWSGHVGPTTGAVVLDLEEPLIAGNLYKVSIRLGALTDKNGDAVPKPYRFGMVPGNVGLDCRRDEVIVGTSDEDGKVDYYITAQTTISALHFCLGEGNAEGDEYYPSGQFQYVSIIHVSSNVREVMRAGLDGLTFEGNTTQKGRDTIRSYAGGQLREYVTRTDYNSRLGVIPSETTYLASKYFRDKNGESVAWDQIYMGTSGKLLRAIGMGRNDANGENRVRNGVIFGIDKDGNRDVTVYDKDAWLTGIGAAAASHNHSAADITSGTLPLSRGGVGSTTAAGARSNIGAAAKTWTILATVATGADATLDLTGYSEVLILGYYSTTYLSSAVIPVAFLGTTVRELYLGGVWTDAYSRGASVSLSKTSIHGWSFIINGASKNGTYRVYAR